MDLKFKIYLRGIYGESKRENVYRNFESRETEKIRGESGERDWGMESERRWSAYCVELSRLKESERKVNRLP